MSPRSLPETFGFGSRGTPPVEPHCGWDEVERVFILSWCKKNVLPCFAFPSSLPSSLPSPSPYPLPHLLLPCRPPRAGPGRAGRGQAESLSPGGSLSLPSGSGAATAARRSRSHLRSGSWSLAAPQDGPPSPHESHRPPQAHPGYLGHRVDHPGHHPHHDSAAAVPSHGRHHLPSPDTPHTQRHRVSHGHRGTASSLGWGLQP